MTGTGVRKRLNCTHEFSTHPKYLKMDLYPTSIPPKMQSNNPYPRHELRSAASSAGKEKRLIKKFPAHPCTFPADRYQNIFKTLSTKRTPGKTHRTHSERKGNPRNARGISSEAGTHSCVAKVLPESHKGASTSERER
jgi:hypothetical protein